VEVMAEVWSGSLSHTMFGGGVLGNVLGDIPDKGIESSAFFRFDTHRGGAFRPEVTHDDLPGGDARKYTERRELSHHRGATGRKCLCK
jgi:hypothetical protein